MKLKRLATMALAGVMTLSLALPAFASGQTDVTAVYESPEISVTVPAKGAVVINPFGLDVQMSENPDAADQSTVNKVTISGQKIVTAPMALQNKTKMNLGVNVTLTGTIKEGSDMRLATEALAADDTSKSAFVYLQAAPSTLAGAVSAVDTAAIAAAYAAWEPTAYNADTDLVLGTRAANMDNVVTLKAAKVDGSGAFEEFKAGSIAFVRLSGDAVASPRTPWAATDGFTATIAYTFAPVQLKTFDITVGTLTKSGAASQAPTNVKFSIEGSEVTKASEGDVVTITADMDNRADNLKWTVVDAEGNTIDSMTGTGTTTQTGSAPFAATATFTMPAQPVTVNLEAAG